MLLLFNQNVTGSLRARSLLTLIGGKGSEFCWKKKAFGTEKCESEDGLPSVTNVTHPLLHL